MLGKRVGFSGPQVIESITPKLFQNEPLGDFGLGRAGVAVIFKLDGAAKILLIKRAEKEGDPWSGQVAFPGGRVADGDENYRQTAVRETREEVGLDLRRASKFLGYLGVFRARTRGMMVVPSIFTLQGGSRISLNLEVASYRWVSITSFESDSNRSIFHRDYEGVSLSFPAYSMRGYVIWGLTERIISTLMAYL